jgi:hypothetical protein
MKEGAFKHHTLLRRLAAIDRAIRANIFRTPQIARQLEVSPKTIQRRRLPAERASGPIEYNFEERGFFMPKGTGRRYPSDRWFPNAVIRRASRASASPLPFDDEAAKLGELGSPSRPF